MVKQSTPGTPVSALGLTSPGSPSGEPQSVSDNTDATAVTPTIKSASRTAKNRSVMDTNTAVQIDMASFDNDHTLVGFFNGAVPAWRESLPLVAAALGISVEEVGRKLGSQFSGYATHDYPWALALAFASYWKGTVAEFVEQVERPFWDVQDRCRRKYVKPYPGVVDTLTKLNELGIDCVVVSDAPMFMCLQRVVGAGIGHLIQGIYALDFARPDLSKVPSEEWLRFGDERMAELGKIEHNFKFVRKLSADCEKPDPRGIEMAISDFDVDPARVVHVGDSFQKDGMLTVRANLKGFYHATHHAIPNLPSEYLEMIHEVLEPEPLEGAAHKCPESDDRQPNIVGEGGIAGVLKCVTV